MSMYARVNLYQVSSILAGEGRSRGAVHEYCGVVKSKGDADAVWQGDSWQMENLHNLKQPHLIGAS